MIMDLARRNGKKVIGICGITGDGYEKCLDAGFDKIIPLIHPSMVTAEAVKSLEDTAASVFASV